MTLRKLGVVTKTFAGNISQRRKIRAASDVCIVKTNALNALSRIRTDLVRIRRGGRGVALKKSPLRGGFAYIPASSDETPVPA